jgi:hypothetical protein
VLPLVGQGLLIVPLDDHNRSLYAHALGLANTGVTCEASRPFAGGFVRFTPVFGGAPMILASKQRGIIIATLGWFWGFG